ncbi:hypothetical protein PAAG_01598 [Paracoccidioides lutzii Pb01]|uniref:Uncharacterized protein n=1 Tax=Paracoccidioides lutzii (strain ATCC MYA-826 / Pb01) TaxID=502779 RepID=C1GSV3_PARBA|nr:hypothetical protein PAAG_01598 [Paracoccidioides lutzii Pb01]EEH39136.2 hypothetical protein PAAG_01598 [Paracoccidioides lutzii Pb01]
MKQLQEHWTNEIEKDVMIDMADTGYNNDQITFSCKLEAMEDIKDSEYIQIGLEKLYKGSIMMVNTVTLLQDELSKTAAATAACERRQQAS